MGKASEGALSDLHGVFALHCMERLKSGDCTASDMNVIRQFLKDNGINCIGPGSPEIMELSSLAEKIPLPQFEDE